MSSTPDSNNRSETRRSPRHYVQASLRNAAIYDALSKSQRDEDRSAAYARLSDIEADLAKRWAQIGGVAEFASARPRLSLSLSLLRIVDKLLSHNVATRLLRIRHRRSLIASSEEIQRHGLQSTAVESAELLQKLSGIETDSEGHEEHGFLASESGALRAGVLGINDGLISNFSLAMGVAAGTNDQSIVLLAGLAGLIAGALSMAAGEYISVISQREYYANLVRWERAELMLWHEEEEEELARIYERKGLEKSEAATVASRIMSDPETALDVHVREELGIDPEDLGGSPWVASITSFGTFAIGALIPITPFIFDLNRADAIAVSVAISGTSLLVVGGGLGWMTSTGVAKAGLRMLMLGVTAAAITYGLGTVVGNLL